MNRFIIAFKFDIIIDNWFSLTQDECIPAIRYSKTGIIALYDYYILIPVLFYIIDKVYILYNILKVNNRIFQFLI